ncbi:hypothetical protein EHI_066760 [Entamoeba histolytica HM-1:IMSS]|uniref:Uncharacterized protein n=8 Tax=Entamoeba TaxID=5758 RepID=B1N4Q3_ENTH1|nr:hypothetical protein EHI_066760 [Entamoeba histolytica HM-1:IMSS]EDS89056.1 hypothetical protein EHI_066760 [Entamoeba histolytica HM-1:IMSS]EMD46287.1 Hypothetical protein EHI5A_229090 [Entamoeba histolytica KU27]ENY62866.1 hypothetical protein EHI7A_193500 [Entamoeba histolytica HM-1:IMSS-A]|eukprot:XP_001914169.1 hypothetical protein EHI_066760 [Entamoeba histolytica HM-1:IMSS]
MGLMIFLTGLIHLCANPFGSLHVKGIVTQGAAVVSIVALLLLLTGICTLVSPFFGFIPFPIIRKFGSAFSPYVVIPWFVVHGFVCLFMTGVFGCIVGIFCFITVIISVIGIFFSFYQSSDDE